MSYLDRKHASNRTATIIVAAVIEAAAIYAVVQGLSGTFTRQPPREPLVGEQIKLDPPPPPVPHPTPSAKPSARPDHVIAHRNDFDRRRSETSPILPMPMPTSSPVPMPTPDICIEPQPKPPSFTSRAAKPIGQLVRLGDNE